MTIVTTEIQIALLAAEHRMRVQKFAEHKLESELDLQRANEKISRLKMIGTRP